MQNTIPQMNTLEKFGEKLFSLRDYTPIPVGIIAILFANPTLTSLCLGFLVVVLGEFFRIYGVAFIGTISRTRSYSNGELVKSGPFSLLRNPLYFGNLTLTVGFALMTGVMWIPVMTIAFFYFQYIPIVAWEEMKLKNIFGQAFLDYCSAVPNRWFPSLAVLIKGKWFRKPDSWTPALKSEKRTFTAVAFVTLALFALYFLDKREATHFLPLISLF